MKVRNDTNETGFDPSGTFAPQLFYGPGAPNTDRRFTDPPVMSLYWDVTNAAIYIKLQNNKVAIDWQPFVVTGAITSGYVTISGTLEVSGDVDVGGTLTAGDIAAEV